MSAFSAARILALALAPLLAAIGPAQSEATRLKVATEGTYYPMSYFDAAGKITGFEVDLTTELCKKAEIECEFVIMAYDGMIPALQVKQIDAIATGMRITAKRKEVVDFVDPYYFSKARFVVCADGKKISGNSPEAMKGVKIGVQSSSTTSAYLAEFYKESDVRLYKSADDAFLDLASGRLEAAISNEFIGYGFLESDKGAGCEFLGENISHEMFGEGVGIALRKGEDEIRERLNAALKTALEDGTYESINKRYFPFSIY